MRKMSWKVTSAWDHAPLSSQLCSSFKSLTYFLQKDLFHCGCPPSWPFLCLSQWISRWNSYFYISEMRSYHIIENILQLASQVAITSFTVVWKLSGSFWCTVIEKASKYLRVFETQVLYNVFTCLIFSPLDWKLRYKPCLSLSLLNSIPKLTCSVRFSKKEFASLKVDKMFV